MSWVTCFAPLRLSGRWTLLHNATARRHPPPLAMLSPSKRPRAPEHFEPVERVELFLGGVFRPSGGIEEYLRQIARVGGSAFAGEVRFDVGCGKGRATLSGAGARQASASALGRRQEDNRPLAEVKLHNEWYCPCGLSG